MPLNRVMNTLSKTLCLLGAMFLCRCGANKFFAEKDKVVSTVQNQKTIEHTVNASFSEPKPINILWVIDHSGSMGEEHQKLKVNFPTFIDRFLHLKVPFVMDIINVQNPIGFDSDKKLNSTYAQRDEAGFKKYFNDKIQELMSDGGNGIEKGILQSLLFLQKNPSWTQKDNYLVIIYVGDEDDCTVIYGTNGECSGVKTVDEYLSDLSSFKSSPQWLKVFAITNQLGKSFKEMAELTGGDVGDIMRPFDRLLDNFSEQIVKLANSAVFKKSELDLSKLDQTNVYVNDKLVPKEKWSATDNGDGTVTVFFKDYTLPEKSKVSITRTLLNRSFPIEDSRPDPTKLEKMEVHVNGEPIDSAHWDYIEADNAIRFKDSYIPPNKAVITIVFTDD